MGLNSSKVHNFSAHFCSWQVVFCDSKEQRVVRLVATGLGLSGVISENTIGKLTMLEMLDLSNNNLTGLPSDIWSLGSLKFLNLSFNQLSGVLSSNIGNFPKLESLDLSYNNVSGSMPEAMGSLLSLQFLNLSQNGFDSKVPSGIMNCHSLVSLDPSGNKLSDSLHYGFGAAFPKLQFLNLAENEIHGKDSVLSGMVSLTYLNVLGNLFKGSIGVFGGGWTFNFLQQSLWRFWTLCSPGHLRENNLGISVDLGWNTAIEWNKNSDRTLKKCNDTNLSLLKVELCKKRFLKDQKCLHFNSPRCLKAKMIVGAKH